MDGGDEGDKDDDGGEDDAVDGKKDATSGGDDAGAMGLRVCRIMTSLPSDEREAPRGIDSATTTTQNEASGSLALS